MTETDRDGDRGTEQPDNTLPMLTDSQEPEAEVAGGNFSLTESGVSEDGVVLWINRDERPEDDGPTHLGRELAEPEAIDLAIHLLQAVTTLEGGSDPVSLLEAKLETIEEDKDRYYQPGDEGHAYFRGQADALRGVLEDLGKTPLHNHPDEAEVSYRGEDSE